MKISKDVKFDCAHLLSNYKGKCSNLHGHTYHGTITLEGSVGEDSGMVTDYNVIKQVVDQFDHAVLISHSSQRDEAEEELLQWAQKWGMRTVEMPKAFPKTTAENIVAYIRQLLLLECTHVPTVTVRLSETDGSWAEV